MNRMSPHPFTRNIVAAGIAQGLLFATLWSWILASFQNKLFLEVLIPFGFLAGMSFGMAMSLVFAWLLQIVSIRVPVNDRIDFLFRLNEAAATLGYSPARPNAVRVVYQPRLNLGKTSRLVVQFEGAAAVIAGPQLQIVRLRRYLGR
jgi:hypothetical protein